MITDYIQAALRRAEYKKLADGTWFTEIPGFDGVWANGQTVEGCRSELIEVLEDWVLLKVRDHGQDISRDLIREILRQAGVSPDDWEKA